MTERYSHRNGESNLPTIDGYFWVDSEVTHMVIVHQGGDRLYIWGVGVSGWINDFDDSDVHFWGPIEPPAELSRD